MTEREQLELAMEALETHRTYLGEEIVNTALGAMREKLAAISALERSRSAKEQRKLVTVLFGDISGFTGMSETLDPEELRDRMNAVWARLDAAILEHGGTIDKHIGDAVMALWGVDVAREDDAEHAVRAALAMHAELASIGASIQSPVALRMRIGINTGFALLGSVATTSEFTAMGDTVNVASRLEHAAPIGSTLISHDTYRQVRGLFEIEALEPILVKGKTEALRVYRVDRIASRAFRAQTRGVEGVDTRIIGRQSELERLKSFFEETRKGSLQTMMVVADAGIGKSRLLDEFRRYVSSSTEPVEIFEGRATEDMQRLPFSLIRDVFSFRFGISGSEPKEVARQTFERGIEKILADDPEASMKAHFLGHVCGFDFSESPHIRGIRKDPQQIRDRAFRYLGQTLDAAGRFSVGDGSHKSHRPALILIDDLHWADEGSLDALSHIQRACAALPICLVVLARASFFERRPLEAKSDQMLLSPLDRDASGALVDEILKKAKRVPRTLKDLVVDGAEGNPLYIEELIKMLVDERVIIPGAEEWRIADERIAEVRVPPSLVGLIQARLEGLGSSERDVLRWASIIGRSFWDGALFALARATGERSEDIHEALGSLQRRGLIAPRGLSQFAGAREFHFAHLLFRDVAYGSVLLKDRRAGHARAAQWLIEHCGERTDEYAMAIGEHLERSLMLYEASYWFGRAGFRAQAISAPETAIEHFERAVELANGHHAVPLEKVHEALGRRIELYEGLGDVLWQRARFADALDAYEKMRQAAEARGDVNAQARALIGSASAQQKKGDAPSAVVSAERAEELAQAAGLEAERIRALCQRGMAYGQLGQASRMLPLAEEALERSDRLGAPRETADVLRLLGIAYDMNGRFAEAAGRFERARVLYEALGDRRMVAAMLNNLGVSADYRGDFAASAEFFAEAFRMAREIGFRVGEMQFLSNLGVIRVRLGDYVAAERDLREVQGMVGADGKAAFLPELHCSLAEAILGRGGIDEAALMAQRALELARVMQTAGYLGPAWRVLAKVAAAREKVQGGRPDAGATDALPPASVCFSESVKAFVTTGAEAGRARTLRDWALFEAERGNDEFAQSMWSEAREIFARLGLEHEMARMGPSPASSSSR